MSSDSRAFEISVEQLLRRAKKRNHLEQVGFLIEYVTENIPGKVVRDPHESNYIYCIAKSIYCLLNTWDQFLCCDPANIYCCGNKKCL